MTNPICPICKEEIKLTINGANIGGLESNTMAITESILILAFEFHMIRHALEGKSK